MLINKVIFYKTPLDSSYTNVIDFNSDDISNYNNKDVLKITLLDKLKTIFDEYYEPLSINTGIKGLKNNSYSSSLVVNEPYSLISEYNYCIIMTDLLYPKFYFIDDIISQNDNPANPSCVVNLTYDVWNNNIYELTFNSYYGGVNTRHYDRISKIENDELVYNMYNVINTKFDYFIDNYKSENNRYKILYCVYEFKNVISSNELLLLNDVSIGFLSRGKIKEVGDVLFTKYNKSLLYMPIGILDTHNNSFVEGLISSGRITIGGHNFNGNIEKQDKFFNIPVLFELLKYTAKIHLTYHSPYPYTYSDYDDEGEKIPTFKFTFPLSKIKSKSIYNNVFEYYAFLLPTTVTYEDVDYTITENETVNAIKPIVDNITNSVGKSETINLYKSLKIPSSWSDFTSVDEVEPQEYTYPLNYLSLSINEYQYPLVSSKIDNKDFVIDSDYRGFQNHITVRDENGVIYSPQGFFMNTNGSLSFSIDALDDYLIRNGSQEKTAISISKIQSGIDTGVATTNGVLGLLGGLLTGNPTTVLSGAQSLTSIPSIQMRPKYKEMEVNALHKDLINTPDTYTVSTGENDKIFQDRLQIYHYTVDKNNVNYKKMVNEFKIYGYQLKSVEDLHTLNNRIYYDFIKCDYVDLPFNIPNIDKKILCNIFINGVHKNHYNYNNGLSLFNSTFDKKIINNERKFLFDDEYKNWLAPTMGV